MLIYAFTSVDLMPNHNQIYNSSVYMSVFCVSPVLCINVVWLSPGGGGEIIK